MTETQATKSCVLVIDDDPFLLKLLSRQLAMMDVQYVTTCQNGNDALAFLDENNCAELLILLDLNMPQMDGVEFVRCLVHRHFAGALALVSGEDQRIVETAVNLARARNLDVLGQLDKPVRREALQDLVDRWRSHVAKGPRNARKTYPPEEISRAIAAGELFNLYQPQVDLATGALSGVETLVRWQHPEDGVVYPDQFIQTAEEHNLMDQLTVAVLTEALAQAALWRTEGFPVRTAVNVSMDNLTNLDFPDLVLRALAASGASAAQLFLEVTESRLMKDPITPLDILTRLRLKHIGLSIDDFGTGHSSLAQLRDIPFNELKIDRSFVHGACRDSTLRSILEASLSMAKQLGMTVVGEGVEDEADWNFLRACRCDQAQGYFIAKPMPAAGIRPWHATWEARRNALTKP